jgi:hypothetical protein
MVVVVMMIVVVVAHVSENNPMAQRCRDCRCLQTGMGAAMLCPLSSPNITGKENAS